MSDIILPKGKCGWLYGITLTYNNREGFGITGQTTPRSRLVKGYCNPSASTQTFRSLWYGFYQHIISVETFIKNQYGDKLLVLLDKKLEWFDPEYNITHQDLIQIVEKRIKDKNYNIYRVQNNHLPFTPRTSYKDFKNNPSVFLETI
jgi:hypothetical protein